jgi:MFS family permease
MIDNKGRNYLLIAVVFTSISSPLMLSAVNVALPAIGNELSMNPVQLGWVNQALTLTLVMLTLPFGRLADIIGRKKIYTAGLILFTVTVFMLALSTSPAMLISLRAVQGISLAMMWSTSAALLTQGFPYNERGRVLGLITGAHFLASSIGPTMGGILTQNLGWRSIFFLAFILQLPALVLMFTKVKGEESGLKREKYDVIGSVLFAVTLFSVAYGFSALPGTMGIGIFAVGAIMLAAFIVWELRTESPLFDIHLLTRNRMFAFSSLTQLIFHCAIYPIGFTVSLYLQYVRGLSPQDAGFVLLAQPLVQAIFSPIAGKISDKVQPRVIVSIGVAIALVGLLVLLSIPQDGIVWLYVVSLVLIGLGTAFFASPNTSSIMGAVENRYYGIASAFQAVSRDIGITLGMGILMLFLSFYLGTAQITPEYHAIFGECTRMAYLVFAALGFCCILVSLSRGKRTIGQ